MKVLIVAALLAIIGSLAHAMSAMSSGPGGSRRMAQALTVRIAVSFALFALLMAGWYFGVLTPHGV